MSCTIQFIYKTNINTAMKVGKSIKWDTPYQQTN